VSPTRQPPEHPPAAHLTEHLFDAWSTGQADLFTVLGAALLHLEECCPGCREGLRRPEPVDVRAALAEGAARALLRAEELEEEGRRLGDLLAELAAAGVDPEERALDDERLQTLAFADHLAALAGSLLDEGVPEGFPEGARPVATAAVAHLETAYQVLLRLEPAWYGAPRLRYAEARVFLSMARAQVARGDHEAATETASMGAEAWFQAGEPETLHPLLLLAMADVALAIGKKGRALRFFTEVASHRAATDAHRAVAALAAARLERWAGEPVAAVRRLLPVLQAEEQEIGQGLERRLRAELVLATAAAGDATAAGKALAELVAGLDEADDRAGGGADAGSEGPPADPLEAFARGRVFLLAGRRLAAEGDLLEARRGYLARGDGLAATAAHLALLGLRLQDGRPDQARALASDLGPFALCPGMDRDLLAGLSELAGALWGAAVGEPPAGATEALAGAERMLIGAHTRRGLSARGDVPT